MSDTIAPEEPEDGDDDVTVNPITGEVEEWSPKAEDASEGVLMPMNLAAMSEQEIQQMLPSALQMEGALLISRSRLGRAPQFLREQRERVKAAKRALIIARGYAFVRTAGTGSEAHRRALASVDQAVLDAQDLVDTQELTLEYALDLWAALRKDVDILRSLNANVREERK
jgi:hypothetical protein